MSQPQYNDQGFNSGSTPSPETYQNPTSAAPVVDCQAAVDAAIARRDSLETSQNSIPNMSNLGTHAGPIGLDNDGVSNTIGSYRP